MVLNAGEVFVWKVVADDLSGTAVESSKPVIVLTARRSANSPSGYAYGGQLMENTPSTVYWGKRYAAVPTPGRAWGDTFRVYATNSGTTAYVNGRVLGTIGRGQWIEYRTQTVETKLFTSTNPIMVQQQMNGALIDGITGSSLKPSMRLLVPLEQGLMTYTISTPKDKLRSGSEFVNSLNIAAPAAGDVQIYVDGVAVTGMTSNSLGILTATVSITPGAHIVTGSIPFVLSVFGTRNLESYMHPGGSNFAQLARVNSVTLTPNSGSYLVSQGARCFVAQVNYEDSTGVPGVPVYFQKLDGTYLAGANADENGSATVCYTGTAGDSGLKVVAGWLETTADVRWRATASSDANVSNLESDSASLTPAFVSTTTYYTGSTADAATTFTITLSDPNSVYTLTSSTESCTPANGGNGYTASAHSCALAYGDNLITVTVVAEDQSTTVDYSVLVKRLQNDANLGDFEIAPGTLAPTFFSGTASYTAVVDCAASSVTVTPTLSDPNATYTITGSPGICSLTTTSAECDLLVGANVITVTVTAEDGVTTVDYVVTITRLSNDANLLDLEISAGTLVPAFVSGTTSYTAEVENAVSSVTVTPTLSDPGATYTITGSPGACSPATEPASCALAVGANVITVMVKSVGGIDRVYTATITRSASADATLSGLEIEPGALSPAFVSSTMEYSAAVPTTVSSVLVTPTLHQAHEVYTITGSPQACTPVMEPAVCELSVGENVITVTVTAQDESRRRYVIRITRAAPPSTPTQTSSPTQTPGGPTATPTPTHTSSPTQTPDVVFIGHVWPQAGAPAGGMPVAILGNGFMGALSVTVGGASVPFTVTNDGRVSETSAWTRVTTR